MNSTMTPESASWASVPQFPSALNASDEPDFYLEKYGYI